MLDPIPNPQPEADLLKTVLQPLLEDFQYWFDRSRSLLETYRIDFLDAEQQVHLLERVKQAQQEVGSAQALFQATGGQVGIETSVMVPWHQLVMECWQVGMRFRREHLELEEK
ncbi:MAG TPA: DUF2605 domain-containing protein [Coleofasciculaceae cyanobacterium]